MAKVKIEIFEIEFLLLPNISKTELFMLYQLWLQDIDIDIDIESYTANLVLQYKTEAILSKLDFQWCYVNSGMLYGIISKSFDGNNLI